MGHKTSDSNHIMMLNDGSQNVIYLAYCGNTMVQYFEM